MYRQLLVGTVSLLLAGCAQTPMIAPALKAGPRLPPVGLTPVPNIHEAINRENHRLDPAQLHPELGPVLANLGAESTPSGMTIPNAGANPVAGADCGCRTPSGPGMALVPELRTQPPVTAIPAQAATSNNAMGTAMAPSTPAPDSLPDLSLIPLPDAVPAMAPAPMTQGSPEIRRTSVASGAAESLERLEPPLVPDPSLAPMPDAVPLPGPEPQSMPAAEIPPEEPGKPAQPEVIPLEPASPLDLPSLPGLEAKDPSASLPAMPLPEAAVTSAPGSGKAARAGAGPTYDNAVQLTGGDLTSMHDVETPVRLKEAGRIAARVGDEVITHNELAEAVKEKIASMPGNHQPNREEIMMITSYVVDSLIERSIIIQEAKREMKKPEMIQRFMKIADKVWHEEELQPLLRKMAVVNEYELKEKFKEQGKSLDDLREHWKQDFLAKGFLEQKLRPKITVEISEMRTYYNAHLAQYDRPAEWTWREAVVEVDKHASRAEARQKAESILARIRHGDDFAEVAKAESEGPNRKSGGFWQTGPDSYSVSAVNEALKTLPIGQPSTIIEGPSSYHIVRIETRRAAGPASFAEVQDQVRRTIHRQKVDQASGDYLDKLRKQTVVTTIFDKSEYPPASTRNFPPSATP